jgi:hypothetical protein
MKALNGIWDPRQNFPIQSGGLVGLNIHVAALGETETVL